MKASIEESKLVCANPSDDIVFIFRMGVAEEFCSVVSVLFVGGHQEGDVVVGFDAGMVKSLHVFRYAHDYSVTCTTISRAFVPHRVIS